MKGLGKKLLSLAMVFVFALSTFTIAYADTTTSGNTTLIKKSTTIAGYTQVSKDSKASFTLKTKRADDVFTMYNLTTTTWTQSATTGAWNVSIAWTQAIQDWLAGTIGNCPAAYQTTTYSTPTNLGTAEAVVKDGSYTITSIGNEGIVIEFLQAVRDDEDLMKALQGETVGSTTYTSCVIGYHKKDADGNWIASSHASNSAMATVTVVENDALSYTITDAPFGLCFIDASSSTREYQPVLLDLMPIQVGPNGNWYVKNASSYAFKYEEASIEKKINDKDTDVVEVGEIVNFDVTVQIPLYNKDNDGNYESTLFTAYDNMTEGFTLIPASATLYYHDAAYDSSKSDSDNAAHIYHPTPKFTTDSYGIMTVTDTEKTYTARLIPNCYAFYSTADPDTELFFATESTSTAGDYEFFGVVNGDFYSLGYYTVADINNVGSTTYAALLNAYNNKATAQFKLSSSITAATMKVHENKKSVITVTMNYANLMDTLKNQVDGTSSFVPDTLYVNYDAIVNENASVGDDDNKNDVYLYYVEYSDGTVGIAHDDVTAWTYAANLVKVDGDSYNDDTVDDIFLEGAIFDLYQSDVTYCGGSSATAAPSDATYAGYSFLTDANAASDYTTSVSAWQSLLTTAATYYYSQSATAVANSLVTSDGQIDKTKLAAKVTEEVTAMMTALTDAGGYDTPSEFLNKYSAVMGVNADAAAIVKSFILTQLGDGSVTTQLVPVKVDSCTACKSEHYHLVAYSTLWYGIESAAADKGAAGVTVKGLDPNDYLLIERTAPTGYHKLSEGLQFTITSCDEDNDQTYSSFYGDENIDATAYAALTEEQKAEYYTLDDTTYYRLYKSGIYDITVENYKGLTLPSTGGMGTLLFTLLGVLVMAAVIIATVKKRKEESAAL